jgi:hypothetical protein
MWSSLASWPGIPHHMLHNVRGVSRHASAWFTLGINAHWLEGVAI